MNLHKFLGTAMVVLALFIIVSCHTYYMAKTINGNNISGRIDSLNKSGRFFILRNGDEAYTMEDISLSSDGKTAACTLDRLPSNHTLHLQKGVNGTYRYDRRNLNQAEVVNEVHFYTRRDSTVHTGAYNLSLDKIYKIEVLEHDKKRTTNSYVIGTIGTVLGSMVVVGIILVATKSSCPFISAYDGKDFSLQGEIYGGAIYPQLARKDYLPLKMSPLKDGSLQLKISNELKEKQFTDFTRLWRIEHPANSSVFVDQEGQLHCISLPQLPLTALLDGKTDVLPGLKSPADYRQVYMDDSSRVDAINEIEMSFAKPVAVSKAKLILSIKNSYWLDLLYGELAKGFGSYYPTYMSQQKKRPAAELQKWAIEQQMPLSVEINTGEGWKELSKITTTGPVAFRQTAISLDLPQNATQLKVRLRSGFMFWEIDYAAIDYSVDLPFTVEKLEPYAAIDEQGKNVLSSISSEDGVYLEQPSIGNAATISFRSSQKDDPGMSYSYVLESRGYYEHIRDFKNPPDINFISQFRVPGAFPKFGRMLYSQIKERTLGSFAGNNPK